jgi:hypothetical protein
MEYHSEVPPSGRKVHFSHSNFSDAFMNEDPHNPSLASNMLPEKLFLSGRLS